MVGGRTLQSLARELEDLAAAGQVDAVRDRLASLQSLCERFLRESAD